MTISEIRQIAKRLKGDTIHVEYETDGETIAKTAVLRGGRKVFSSPAGYRPGIIVKEDVNEWHLFKISGPGEYEREGWRHI